MNILKQISRMTPLTRLLILFGLVLSFSFLYLGTDTADAASKQAENACKNAVKRVSSNKRQAFRDNINACYYGYDQVGASQNSSRKCANRYSNINTYGPCVAGAELAKRAASRPPPIERCEQDDVRKTQKCKRKYRECNELAGRKRIADCKRERINRFGPGGGGSGSGGSSGRSGGSTTDPPAIGEAGKYICGTYKNEKRNVHTKFDFGCLGSDFDKLGEGAQQSSSIRGISPILDLVFAFVRFLSIGVGIVIAISIIMSGIQYTMSEGNAEVTQKAKSRIRSAVLGLVIYIFAFSMLQFLVPGGVFKPGMWVNESILQLISRLYIWIF